MIVNQLKFLEEKKIIIEIQLKRIQSYLKSFKWHRVRDRKLIYNDVTMEYNKRTIYTGKIYCQYINGEKIELTKDEFWGKINRLEKLLEGKKEDMAILNEVIQETKKNILVDKSQVVVNKDNEVPQVPKLSIEKNNEGHVTFEGDRREFVDRMKDEYEEARKKGKNIKLSVFFRENFPKYIFTNPELKEWKQKQAYGYYRQIFRKN